MRKSHAISVALATTAIVISAGAPAFAASPGPFCPVLKSVTSKTASGFTSLRGAQVSVRQGTSGLTYTDYTYAATTALVGANAGSCQVVTTIDGGRSSGVYRCFFDYGGPKRLAKLQSLALAIGRCIGAPRDKDVDVDDAGDSARSTSSIRPSS